MKKLILLTTILIFLAGCSPNELQVSNLREQKESKIKTAQLQEEIKDKEKNTPSFSKEIQTFIDICNKSKTEEKNKCLYSRIHYRVFETKDNIALCNLIEKDSESYAKCLWLFAMEYKDTKICEEIVYSETFEDEFLNPEDCKLELNYKTANSNWKLKNGIPYLADAGPQYEGEATIKAWLVEEEFFGSPVTHLRVSSESIKNLPRSFQDPNWQSYSLKKYVNGQYENLENEVFENLKKYSETNPATIKINAISTRWESVPAIGFVEIVNP